MPADAPAGFWGIIGGKIHTTRFWPWGEAQCHGGCRIVQSLGISLKNRQAVGRIAVTNYDADDLSQTKLQPKIEAGNSLNIDSAIFMYRK